LLLAGCIIRALDLWGAIRALADNIGLTAGLSKALASDRLLVHDRGRRGP
jgi:hypothetical protein